MPPGWTHVPQLGAMVRGFVTRITSYGAFVKVPGYLDGLLHFSRMSDSKTPIDESSARTLIKEDEAIFAKVVLVGPGRYSLDIRFVDQEDGSDLDPDNIKRIELEPAIADGVWQETSAPHSERSANHVELNKIYRAVVVKEFKYGVFVKITEKGFNDKVVGLVPSAKLGKAGNRFGDKLIVKVVEIQKGGKFNCDARFVDQRSGEDLDPEHEHTVDKLTVDGAPIPLNEFETQRSAQKTHTPRRERKTSRSRELRRNERKRSRGRDRSESVIRRPRNDDRKRSESVIRRPRGEKRERSDSVIRRRRERSDSRKRSESGIRRPRDRKRSESVIRRPRNRSESVIRRPGRGDDERAESRGRRARSRGRDPSEDIIIRRR